MGSRRVLSATRPSSCVVTCDTSILTSQCSGLAVEQHQEAGHAIACLGQVIVDTRPLLIKQSLVIPGLLRLFRADQRHNVGHTRRCTHNTTVGLNLGWLTENDAGRGGPWPVRPPQSRRLELWAKSSVQTRGSASDLNPCRVRRARN